MSYYNIGIIGMGYVGDAITHAIEKGNYKRAGTSRSSINVYTYDIQPKDTRNHCKTIETVVKFAEIIFVCVPTPMRNDGLADTSIVEEVVSQIASFPKQRIIVIKSTVPPGTTDRLQQLYPRHAIFFNPEFLTEKNSREDYINGPVIIGKPEITSTILADQLLQLQTAFLMDAGEYGTIRYATVTNANTAEMLKYAANSFLATKVSFANEMAQIAEAIGVKWSEVVVHLREDERLGRTHWNVPGPDGKLGWGGSCFPKDVSALIKYAHLHGVGTPVLEGVWNRNVVVDRPEKDWELLKGRTISE